MTAEPMEKLPPDPEAKDGKSTKQQPITIGGVEIPAGRRTTVRFPLPSQSRYAPVSLPVKVIHGRRPGPKLFLTGAIHGDEINGVEIIRRVFASSRVRHLRGTLVGIPIVNIYGFNTQSRYLPDRRDLNRSFPGSEHGSLAARLANALGTQILSKCEYGIDLHTGANQRVNLPHIRAQLDDPETMRLAKAFGTPVIIHANLRDGSMRQWGNDNGIRILLYEAGEALRFDELSIRAGVRGTLRVMRALGMIQYRRRGPAPEPTQARSSLWIRATQSGLVRLKVGLGMRVTQGQNLGVIADTFGENEEPFISPYAGIIIGRTNSPVVNEGDAVLHVARFSDASKVESAIETFHEENIEGLGPGDYHFDQ